MPEPMPVIAQLGDVWSYTVLDFVAVTALAGKVSVELGYRVDWDIEHTLGAQFEDGWFIALCGSVVRP